MKNILKNILMFIVIVISITANGQTEQVAVKVVFPFAAENVILKKWCPDEEFIPMQLTGKNEFTVMIDRPVNNCTFNIMYSLPQYNITDHFVAQGKSYTGNQIPNRLDGHGIKYVKLYLNNNLINNLYTVKNWDNTGMDITFQYNSENNIVPFNNSTHPPMPLDDRIPPEVNHHNSFMNSQYPQIDDINVVGWGIALADRNILDDPEIEIDYLRVYGRLNNNLTLLSGHEYDSYNPDNDGGLYLRFPFFPEGFNEHDPMPGTVLNSIVKIQPGMTSDKVWHWWTPRYEISQPPFQFDSYRTECRLRIIGHAVVQIGIDFRDASETVHELGVSDWYFENNGQWQTLIFDSQDFLTRVSSHAVSITTNLKYSCADKSLTIDYENIIPSQYILEVVDLSGKVIFQSKRDFPSTNGKDILNCDLCTNKIVIYSLISDKNKITGKLKIN